MALPRGGAMTTSRFVSRAAEGAEVDSRTED
jgi:hypothetical protein